MYGRLYAVWQCEFDNSALQPLSSDFYAQVADYIKRIEKEIQALDNKSVKALLLEQELKNVRRIFGQLMRIRYKKIIMLINESGKLPTELMTFQEAQLSGGYLPFVESYRAFVKGLLQDQSTQVNLERPVELPNKRVVLRFLKAMPAVIGGDMKTYGPFVPEDVASVPIENAKILLRQGFAVQVNVS